MQEKHWNLNLGKARIKNRRRRYKLSYFLFVYEKRLYISDRAKLAELPQELYAKVRLEIVSS